MNDETIDTRARILEAAVRIFAQKGYHETRVDDIVAESNTFTGLLESRLNEAIQNEKHGIQQLDIALSASLNLFSQYRTLAKIVLVQAVGLGAAFETRRRYINDRFTLIIKSRLDRAVNDGSIPPIQTDLAARVWVGALNEVVVHWIYSGESNLELAIPALRVILLRSIGVPSDRIPLEFSRESGS
jgi:hypothetical protein